MKRIISIHEMQERGCLNDGTKHFAHIIFDMGVMFDIKYIYFIQI